MNGLKDQLADLAILPCYFEKQTTILQTFRYLSIVEEVHKANFQLMAVEAKVIAAVAIYDSEKVHIEQLHMNSYNWDKVWVLRIESI